MYSKKWNDNGRFETFGRGEQSGNEIFLYQNQPIYTVIYCYSQ